MTISHVIKHLSMALDTRTFIKRRVMCVISSEYPAVHIPTQNTTHILQSWKITLKDSPLRVQ